MGERKEFPEQGNALDSILEIANGVAQEVSEKKLHSVPEDLSINLDLYLYGSEKTRK